MSRRHCRTTLKAIAILGCLSFGTRVEAITCPTVGVDTASEFIDLVDCLYAFEREHSLNRLSPDTRSRFAPYVAVLDSARGQLNARMKNDILPAMTSQQLADFETTITSSGILDEINAYTSFLSSPGSTPLAEQDDKKAKTNMKDSLKQLLEDAINAIPNLEFVKAILKSLIDIVFEILEILGKSK